MNSEDFSDSQKSDTLRENTPSPPVEGDDLPNPNPEVPVVPMEEMIAPNCHLQMTAPNFHLELAALVGPKEEFSKILLEAIVISNDHSTFSILCWSLER